MWNTQYNSSSGWKLVITKSYKHSYNANSGVVVIFVNHTRKLYYSRESVTSKCIDDPQHIYYRNWLGTLAAMESNVIAEVFIMSE